VICITNLKDIAKIVKVDVSTVSRALHNSSLVRAELRAKIQQIAKKMNYVPNASAYSLKKKINKTIALVFPYLKFPGGEFYGEIIQGIDQPVDDYQFAITLADYGKQNNTFARIVMENRVDGAIIVGDIFSNDDLAEIDSFSIPIVLINQRLTSKFKNIVDVFSNNINGAELLCEHLIVKHNRKKILFLSGGANYQTNQERIKGAKKISKKAGVDFNIAQANFAEMGSGYTTIKELITQNKFNYDAIMCGNDTIAIGAIKALKENRIKVPEQVSVTGFDNIKLSEFVDIPLTTIDPSAYEMGRMASEVLLKWIVDKEKPKEHKYEFEQKLIIRKSCGC